MNYFVTAIGTDCGKTVVSAILCRALQADYWKPVQAGLPTDADQVKSLVDLKRSVIHPETYRLKTPASPHAAAFIEGKHIQLDHFGLPDHKGDLIIEGAGGCLVPLNDTEFVIDLASKFNTQVILVSNFYLGSINHTLLTFEALKARKLSVRGIIFNGPANEESQRIILKVTGLKCLLQIHQEPVIDGDVIAKYATKLLDHWND